MYIKLYFLKGKIMLKKYVYLLLNESILVMVISNGY